MNRKRGSPPHYLCLDPVVPWTRVDRPIDWPALFGREAPLIVEIGFGNGEALARRALRRPEQDHIGVEMAWSSTKRALRRLAKQEIKNVRLLQTDVYNAFLRLLGPETLTGIKTLFPIPWPKDRHEGRRVFSREFLNLANNRLLPGGEVQLVTDYEPYLHWALEQVQGTGFKAEWTRRPPVFETKYERKWRETGQTDFFELLLTKEEHIDPPRTEEPNLIAYKLKEFDPENFKPQDRTGPITVKFRDYIYDGSRRHGMLHVLVAEDRLVQEVWLKVIDLGDHWHLGVAAGNQILPTEGIKLALELARQAAED